MERQHLFFKVRPLRLAQVTATAACLLELALDWPFAFMPQGITIRPMFAEPYAGGLATVTLLIGIPLMFMDRKAGLREKAATTLFLLAPGPLFRIVFIIITAKLGITEAD